MTVFEANPVNALNGLSSPDHEGDDDLLVRLRRWASMADTTADELAMRGGQERETAAQHMQNAARYDSAAVAARERADELREVIGIVEERRRQRSAELADHGPMDGSS